MNETTATSPIKPASPIGDSTILIKTAFKAFPKVWWRILTINIVVLVTISLGTIPLGLIAMNYIGGWEVFDKLVITETLSFKDINFNVNDLYNYGAVLGILFILMLTWVITFGVLGKIAKMLVIRDYVQRKTTNPIDLLFSKSWQYFWSYAVLGLRMFFYVSWPFLLVLLLAFPITVNLSIIPSNIRLILNLLVTLLAIGTFAFMLYRSLKVILAPYALIDKTSSSEEALNESINLTKNIWWKFLKNILPFSILMFAMSFFSSLILPGLDIIFITPLTLSFFYFLMLDMQSRKNQG